MQATSAAWKALWATGARLETRATIAGTVYADVGAPVITRAAMRDGLSVGNVVSACCVLAVRTTDAIPRSAEVQVEMRLTDGETASEWLPAGTFYISRRSRDPVAGVVMLECYDALLKANAAISMEGVSYPRAMADVAADIAGQIGVELDTRTDIGTGDAYTLEAPAEGTSARDVLARIGATNAGNWIVTPENKLRLVPLMDAAEADEATEDVADVAAVVGGIYVGDTATVTGVRYTDGGALPVLIGDDSGVVLEVSLPYAYAQLLAGRALGLEHRPCTLSSAVYDPAAELGDWVRYGEGVASALYSEAAALGAAFRGDISAPDPAEMADEYPYPGASERALSEARAYALEAAEGAVEALDQEAVFNKLTNNGEAQGLILYGGQLYINASFMNVGELNAAIVRIRNLSANDITSGVIHSADYRTVQVPLIYPAADLYPGEETYPSNGEYVTSGFAIDFETGQIYGGFYSERIATLEAAVLALESALVYPKERPAALQAALPRGIENTLTETEEEE